MKNWKECFMITNLTDFKNLKKIKKVYNDLLEVQKELTNSIERLKKHIKYIPVNESLSVLHNSRTIVEIHINKFKRVLDGKES